MSTNDSRYRPPEYEKETTVGLFVKRRRSEPSEEFPSEAPRDVYEEVLRNGGGRTIRSSWLTNTGPIKLHEVETSSPMRLKNEGPSVKDEIRSIQKQLTQVKRRLAPAAERCTEAVNACHPGSSTTGHREFLEARKACNPLETLGEGRGGGLNKLFMNRSAIKLANIDAILDFGLTRYEESSGCFRFADLCGAPGGFSEYLLKRCQGSGLHCQGYGMSLQGSNENGRGIDWKLQEGLTMENGIISQYQICRGADDSGDVFNWANVQAFCSLIENDRQGGVHLVVADGGFDAQRDAENQEELTQKLVICQVSVALGILRPGGTLVVKMFGFQSPVIRAMMIDTFSMFDSIVALKPISSRPASAERYVVFSAFRGRDPNFTGLKWQSRILLGMASSQSISKDDVERLVHYLNTFDRDLLNLNLKSCFSILSYLELKCNRTSAATQSQLSTVNDFTVLVSIDAYKYAWRLM